MSELHNLAAEESVLGAMLLSRAAVDEALDILRPEHFHKPAHGHIFAAIHDLATKGEPAEPVTVADFLDRAGLLDTAGGIGYVVSLQAAAPAPASVVRHARIVLELAQLRALRDQGASTVELARSMPENVPEAVAQAERSLAAVMEMGGSDALLFAFEDVSDELMDRYLELLGGQRQSLGPKTGLTALDRLVGGLAPGTLTVVGARPSMGKTTLGCKLVRSFAVDQGLPVVFATLEVSRHDIGQRLLSAHCGLDYGRLRRAELHQAETEQMRLLRDTLDRAPIAILDDPFASLSSIRIAARKWRSRHGSLGAVVIDYAGLVNSPQRSRDPRVAMDEIARSSKLLARELDIPVILLAQLNRGLESRADKRPMLSDLRESGGLEQDADIVIFCYRDEVYDRESKDKGIIELIVAKNRTGPTGIARQAWLPHKQDIRDCA